MTAGGASGMAAEASAGRGVDDPTPSAEAVEVAPCLERLGILRLGRWRLGVAGRHCSGLLETSSPTPLPRSPAQVLGVSLLRGKIVPIFDLGLALDVGRDGGAVESPPIGLVVAAGGMTCVLAVDEIVAFEDVDLQQMRDIDTQLPIRLGRFGRGLLQHLGHDVVVLEIPALLEALRHRSTSGAGGGFAEAPTT